ncbi:MAG: type I methionyl aminopeptidase [Endomicrobiia bacterium]
MIELKTSSEIETIKEAGKIVSEILRKVKENLKSGVTTKDLEKIAEKEMSKMNVESAFFGYRGFPGKICVSINEELVHGIPNEKRIIKEGDIVKIDIGIKYKGFYGDIAETIPVGNISDEVRKLLNVTRNCFDKVLKVCYEGYRIGDISAAIQNYVEENGFSVIRDFVGHGIGRKLHEKPEIPNFGERGTGPLLNNGMVLAIEPMVSMGSWKVKVLPDGWTVQTIDKKMCAHYEHMIAITENGPDILTRFFE